MPVPLPSRLIPFALELVPAGGLLRTSVSPGVPFTPTVLLIPSEVAGGLCVVDVLVAGKTQLLKTGTYEHLELPERHDYRGPSKALSARCFQEGARQPTFDECPADGEITLIVFNNTGCFCPLVASMLGTVREEASTQQQKNVLVVGPDGTERMVEASTLSRSEAPWTDEEVASLNRFQTDGNFHEFTGKREVLLIATRHGWVETPHGPVVQTWAHAYMADGSWEKMLVLPRADPG